jgi:hypothetical protein
MAPAPPVNTAVSWLDWPTTRAPGEAPKEVMPGGATTVTVTAWLTVLTASAAVRV